MSVLFCPIGISGSGKTRLGGFMQNVDPSIAVICPDDVRKELTGDVSNQSRNKDVFKLCYERLTETLKAGKDVYFSATNLNSGDRKKLFDIAATVGARVVALILLDSDNPEVCASRVKTDLTAGTVRSNTLTLVEGKSVIDRQYEKFQALDIDKEPFYNVFDFWPTDGFLKAKTVFLAVHEDERPSMRVVWYDASEGKYLPQVTFLRGIDVAPRNEAELVAVNEMVKSIVHVVKPICVSFDLLS